MTARGMGPSAFVSTVPPRRSSALDRCGGCSCFMERSLPCDAHAPPARPQIRAEGLRCRGEGAGARVGGVPEARRWEQRWGARLETGAGRALPRRRGGGSAGSLRHSGCSLCNWSSLILRETMFTDRVLIDLTS